MPKYHLKRCGFNSTIRLLTGAFLALMPSLATAKGGPPSFDCSKAVAPSEKAICGDATLSKMDMELGSAWRAMSSAFSSKMFKETLRKEQHDWLKRREACGGSVECLKSTYQSRQQDLQGKPGNLYNGTWHAENRGDLFIYKCSTGEYLVAIHTSDPEAGAWTCNVEGKATVKKNKLIVTSQGKVITIVHSRKEELSIPPSEENFDSNEHFCGLNGGFTFDYKHVHSK